MRAFLLLVACFQSEPPREVEGTEPDGDPRTAAQEVPEDDASGFRLVVPAERSAAHASARCNDGTPAGFSLRRTDSELRQYLGLREIEFSQARRHVQQ